MGCLLLCQRAVKMAGTLADELIICMPLEVAHAPLAPIFSTTAFQGVNSAAEVFGRMVSLQRP